MRREAATPERVITGEDWERSVRAARAQPNAVHEHLRALHAKRLTAVAVARTAMSLGFEEARSLAPAHGALLSTNLSPAVPVAGDAAEGSQVSCSRGAAGVAVLCAPNGDARSSQVDVGAAGCAANSCAVGSATAGRDRRFF